MIQYQKFSAESHKIRKGMQQMACGRDAEKPTVENYDNWSSGKCLQQNGDVS